MSESRFRPVPARKYMALHGLAPTETAGLLALSTARSTGTLIGVYDAADAAIDDSGGLVLVCEPHGTLLAVESRNSATLWASAPQEWCPICRGDEDYIA